MKVFNIFIDKLLIVLAGIISPLQSPLIIHLIVTVADFPFAVGVRGTATLTEQVGGFGMAGRLKDLLGVLPLRQQTLDVEAIGVQVEDGAVDEIDSEVLALDIFEADTALVNHIAQLLIGSGVEDMTEQGRSLIDLFSGDCRHLNLLGMVVLADRTEDGSFRKTCGKEGLDPCPAVVGT